VRDNVIENERQYEITRRWVERIREALEVTRGRLADAEDSPDRWKLETFEAAYQSQLDDLEREVADYERVHSIFGAPRQPEEEPYPLTQIACLAVDMGVSDLSNRHDWYAHGREDDCPDGA